MDRHCLRGKNDHDLFSFAKTEKRLSYWPEHAARSPFFLRKTLELLQRQVSRLFLGEI